MTSDLFIRSYKGDVKWLKYLIRSIIKHCSGFRYIHIVCPLSSTYVIKHLIDQMNMSLVVKLHECADYKNDYIGQQVTKLHADSYSNAEFIFHIDSDCFFTIPFKPEDMLTAGKPHYLITPYSSFGGEPRLMERQNYTSNILKFQVEHEFMRRQPLVYPSFIYNQLRLQIWNMYGRNLEQHILESCGNNFSEYNLIGAYAYAFFRDNFIWIDTTKEPLPPLYAKQSWSYSPISQEWEKEMERILNEN